MVEKRSVPHPKSPLNTQYSLAANRFQDHGPARFVSPYRNNREIATAIRRRHCGRHLGLSLQ
jgi:hypothetical protein